MSDPHSCDVATGPGVVRPAVDPGSWVSAAAVIDRRAGPGADPWKGFSCEEAERQMGKRYPSTPRSNKETRLYPGFRVRRQTLPGRNWRSQPGHRWTWSPNVHHLRGAWSPSGEINAINPWGTEARVKLHGFLSRGFNPCPWSYDGTHRL